MPLSRCRAGVKRRQGRSRHVYRSRMRFAACRRGEGGGRGGLAVERTFAVAARVEREATTLQAKTSDAGATERVSKRHRGSHQGRSCLADEMSVEVERAVVRNGGEASCCGDAGRRKRSGVSGTLGAAARVETPAAKGRGEDGTAPKSSNKRRQFKKKTTQARRRRDGGGGGGEGGTDGCCEEYRHTARQTGGWTTALLAQQKHPCAGSPPPLNLRALDHELLAG